MHPCKRFMLAAVAIASVRSAPISQDDSVTITDVNHWGSGCPQDAAVTVTSSGNNIIATFGSFDVKLNPQSETTEYCGIGVTVKAGSGWQFSAASSSYHDSIDVAAGVTASHLITYTFSGSDALAVTRHDYVGPLKGTYDCTDTVPASERVWSKCGAPYELLITNRGAVSDGSAASTSTSTSYFNTGSVVTELEWRTC